MLVILQAPLLARIVNGAVFRHLTLAALIPTIEFLFFLFILRGLLTFLSERAAHHAAASVKCSLRCALVGRIVGTGPAFIARERSGDLAATLTTTPPHHHRITIFTIRLS